MKYFLFTAVNPALVNQACKGIAFISINNSFLSISNEIYSIVFTRERTPSKKMRHTYASNYEQLQYIIFYS